LRVGRSADQRVEHRPTHAICDAALGPYRSSEPAPADELWDSLGPEMLCPADRNFYSFERSRRPAAPARSCCGGVKSDIGLPRDQTLSDGFYMTSIYALKNRRARRDGEQARVIEYQLDDPGLPETD